MPPAKFLAAGIALCLSLAAARAAREGPSALARMPVREVTVFKDGHAFVLHSGKLPTDADGNVAMDYLPTPVLGTFWPFAAAGKAKLAGVTAERRRVAIERTALTLRELLEANVGAEVIVTEKARAANQDGPTYTARIAGFPARSAEELEATGPPNAGDRLPQKGSIVLLAAKEGTRAVHVDQILTVAFTGPHKAKARADEFRNLLTLRLKWDGKPAGAAEVGLVYIQKGLRWIPNYRVAIDGEGTAEVELQATLINE